MRSIFRVLVVLVVILAMYFFAYWGSVALIRFDGPDWIRPVACLLFAGSVGWFVWRKLSDGDLSNILLGAVLFGSIGFVGGFFGPMLLTPQANLGPLLGIFITGPLGLVLGAIGGLIYSRAREKNKPKPGSCLTCSYDLTGNTSGTCPECGAPTSAPVTP